MTNFEKIRAMSVEEMAEMFIVEYDEDYYCLRLPDRDRNYQTKERAIKAGIDWLNSPAEENGTKERKENDHV